MITLQPCRNNKEDARIAFSWRNDAATIASSYIARPKSWDSFWLEYHVGYFENPSFGPVFVIEGGEPVGFIRFETAHLEQYPDKTIIEVMINIAPYRRGEGIGTEALTALRQYMKSKNVFALTADIRKRNRASLNAFEKAGFSFLNERTEYISETKENCCILCYLYLL
ncbi:MAG: GNAT family N-acetyltransferase [Alphaproteobacteria bacterium]|nr:GNAT family N-acetyltransferase [Alphaproteobacteria bacterium]